MIITNRKWAALAAGIVAFGMCGSAALGQQSEALMEILVRKGILTEQEAEDLKADLAKENRAANKAIATASPLKTLNFSGDFRGRYEGFFTDEPNFTDRYRWRYRVRFGATATFHERFEVGLRLASGDIDSPLGAGSDPISSNQSFQNNASKKGIFIDMAYGKWTVVTNAGFGGDPNKSLLGNLIFGKMENPFVFSDLVFDGDYTPEGLASQWNLALSQNHGLKASIGGFVLDEIGAESQDPYMWGGQVRWDANWVYDKAHAPKLFSSLGVASLNIEHEEFLSNAAVPNINRGNTRNAAGALTEDYNPVVLDASLTYTLPKAPFYTGTFPIRVGGDYMENMAVDDRGQAFSAGITLGKAGKRGTWEVSYRWKRLEGDAWYEELVDSDFGALYQAPAPTGGSTGYGSGTNVRGHVVKAAYSPYNAFTIGFTWFGTTVIDGSQGDMNRFQLDALWKF